MSNKMKVFNTKDIHSGYIVKFRNGKYALCMRVGRNFTKIFACVDEESIKLGAKEGTTFVYTSRYNIGNHYTDYDCYLGRPYRKTDLDVVAVYGLLEGTVNYLNVGCTDRVSIKNRPLLWEEEVKEMTLEEIEKKLGHKVKIVSSEPAKKEYPIKNADTCSRCKYRFGGDVCHINGCSRCEMRDANRVCRCRTIATGAVCPYFEEDK